MSDDGMLTQALARVKARVSDFLNPPPEPEPMPEWQRGDPRYQYVPGQTARSHVEPPPDFKTPDQVTDWTRARLGGLPVQLEGAADWRDAGAAGFRSNEQRRRDMWSMQRLAPPLMRAYDAGVQMPTALKVQEEQGGKDPDFPYGTATLAFIRPRDGSMHFNEPYMQSRARQQSDVDDTVLHELGHVNDPSATNRGGWSWFEHPDQPAKFQTTAAEMDRYAGTSPDEYVASAYARKALGRDLSPEQTAAYQALHGPPIPRLLPAPPNFNDLRYEAWLRSKHEAAARRVSGGEP
jgi:hypothetical protein